MRSFAPHRKTPHAALLRIGRLRKEYAEVFSLLRIGKQLLSYALKGKKHSILLYPSSLVLFFRTKGYHKRAKKKRPIL